MDALETVSKGKTKKFSYYSSQLLLHEIFNIKLGLYDQNNTFGYIQYNELESVEEYNSYNIVLKEYVYLNISKYFNISFIEYINLPMRYKHDMCMFASKLIEEEQKENVKQKKNMENALNTNIEKIKVNNGQQQ